MRLSISEIFKNANEIDDSDKRIKYLHQNDSPAIRLLLKYCFDERIEFLLPKGGTVPYKPSEFIDAQGMLYSEVKKLDRFTNLHAAMAQPQNKLRREQLFIMLLESIDKNDAELLVSIKDKKLPYKKITRKFIEKVYPGLIDE
jgi:hypothetical protein